MTLIRFAAASLLSLLLATASLTAQSHLLLDGGHLIDGTGHTPVTDVQVLIKNNRIERVGPRGSFEIPVGAERIDTRGKTLLPGFVDLHFHIADDISMTPLFVAKLSKGRLRSKSTSGCRSNRFAPPRVKRIAYASP